MEHSCIPLVLILLLNYRDNVVDAVRSHSLLPVTATDGDGNDTNYYHYKDKFVKHNYDEEEGEYLCDADLIDLSLFWVTVGLCYDYVQGDQIID